MDKADFNHKTCSICLTRHNYIPCYIETGRFDCTDEIVSLYLQNQYFKGNEFIFGCIDNIQDIYIGNQVDSENEEGKIVVDSNAVVRCYATNRVAIKSGFQCKKGGRALINDY